MSNYAKVSKVLEISFDYKWRLRDRLNHIRESIGYNFLLKYNPLDFKTYEVEYNPYGFDIYAKICKTSTPWKRFKRFSKEVKNMIYYTIKAFFYIPESIRYYRKNKKRIDWHEKNIWNCLAATDQERKAHEEMLKSLGYTISKENIVEYKNGIQN